MKLRLCFPLFLAGSLVGFASEAIVQRTAPDDNQSTWIAPMREVHTRFTGQAGTFAQFGDSITVTMAFWAPLPQVRKNASEAMERAFRSVNDHMRAECWREWKGPQFGSEGSTTVRWAREHVEEWLRRLNPETALIMFGSNDLHALEIGEYRTRLRSIVQQCLTNGTVVILSTPPPRSGFVEKAAAFAEAVREIARELNVPLVDFHEAILRRRPDDWNGALEKFSGWQGYDVPTLISRDGVHPSHPKQFQGDYSEEALNRCGFSLRNYQALMKYAEVIEKVLRAPRQSWFPKAPPLPEAKGEIIRVSSVEELFAAAERVNPGGTILLADGHYWMPRYFEIRKDNVTLRSASGRRERVVLDGARSQHGELVGIRRCSGVTIADLTIQNIRHNGFKLNSDYSKDCQIVHNTVHDPENRLQRLIRLVHDNDGLLVANNLLSGPPMRVETTSHVRMIGNVARQLTGSFVNALEGNLHLRESVAGVVDAAGNVAGIPLDIDSQRRTEPADVGVDEFTPPSSAGGKKKTSALAPLHEASARSADFQSAVSPICNRQGVGGPVSARCGLSPAECNSAKRQITNLRYEATNSVLFPALPNSRLGLTP